MRIAICEDLCGDAAALYDYISDYFSRMGYTGEVQTFETGESLLKAFSPGAFDILFLDIYLPGMSGIEAARNIRERDQDCRIIFVTVSVDHSMDCFDVQAVGYLTKPIDQIKMDKTLHICRELFLRSARIVEIPMGRDGSVPLPVANLQYVEIYNKAVKFHMHGSVFEARLSLDEVEDMLGGGPFLRCHRSYIVNMNHVDDTRPDEFLMRNGDRVPMRANGRKEVKLAYARFLAEQTKEKLLL